MWQVIPDSKQILKFACTIPLNNIIVLKTVIERIIYFSGLLISFYFLRHFVIWTMYRQKNIPASLFFTAKFNCSLFEGVFPFIYPEILFGLLEKRNHRFFALKDAWKMEQNDLRTRFFLFIFKSYLLVDLGFGVSISSVF